MKTHLLTVTNQAGLVTEWTVATGCNLREVLLDKGLSPYTALTQRWNCGGRGICATCGVWIRRGIPEPEHWHDNLADQFGYPRLSCQIVVDQDMSILLPQKKIWGKRDTNRKRRRD